jgi:hypothetical protein
MKFILEYKKWKPSYEVGDVVLVEYWYLDEEDCSKHLYKELPLTPVKIIEKLSKLPSNKKIHFQKHQVSENITNFFKVTHNIPNSKIKNAPDEIIKSVDIIDYHR